MAETYQPVLEVTRGRVVESVHFGAAAVVDSAGSLLASLGDPNLVTFLRSSAKPFQALPFIESGGLQKYHLTSRELAIICGSHDGTDEHVEVIRSIQVKVGVQEGDLLCGVHPLSNPQTVESMRQRGEALTPNRHNCSGKHTGMLAAARMRGLPISDYTSPEHPIQKTIRETIASLCSLPLSQVEMGIDGCSLPNYAFPLFHAALGFARMCDPRGLPPERLAACRHITRAMMANPRMVAGDGRFDTRLMQACPGRVVSKGGAEGYMLVGLIAGALGAHSPGIGIAIKISDGDLAIRKDSGEPYNRARPAVALEILRQMGYINSGELAALEPDFGPHKPVTNWRKLVVGESRPAFHLQKAGGRHE
jgi:L-asparaginase II